METPQIGEFRRGRNKQVDELKQEIRLLRLQMRELKGLPID